MNKERIGHRILQIHFNNCCFKNCFISLFEFVLLYVVFSTLYKTHYVFHCTFIQFIITIWGWCISWYFWMIEVFITFLPLRIISDSKIAQLLCVSIGLSINYSRQKKEKRQSCDIEHINVIFQIASIYPYLSIRWKWSITLILKFRC